MNTRKFPELIFETSFTFLDSNIDIRNFNSGLDQLATVREVDDRYVLTSHYAMHNPVYTEHFLATGEYSMLFKVEATIKLNKTVTSLTLANGFHINKDIIIGLAKEINPAYTMEGPPSALDPDGRVISLTTHFKSARGGTHLTKVVWSLPKRIGDEWCDLLYKWAAQ